MESKRQKFVLLGSIILALMWLSPAVSANKIKNFELRAPDGFAAAPQIKVYSTDGEKWNAIDKTYLTTVTAGLYARCKYEGKGNKAYKGSFDVSGFALNGKLNPSNHLIPHSKTVSGKYVHTGQTDSFDPTKVCNEELNKKVAQNPDLKLDEKYRKYPFLEKGFKVNSTAKIRGRYHLTCKPTGAGFTDFAHRTVYLNTVIDCQGSPLAKGKIPKEPVKMAKVILPDMVSKVSYAASPAKYIGNCPAGINFKGNITASRPGTVKYQYVANDGGKSPVFTLKFDKAGTKATGKWHETVSKPDTKNQLAMKGPKTNTPDVSGWWRLNIVEPESKLNSTAKYSVYCKDTPKRQSVIKR